MVILEENKYFTTILESFFDGIYITDHQGLTLYVNSAYERITGLHRDEIVGRNIARLIEDNMFSDSAVLKALESEKTESVRHNYVTGKKALATCTPVFDEQGKIMRVVCNVRDISELLNLRKELKKARQLSNIYQHELHELREQTKVYGDMVVRNSNMLKVLDFAARAAAHESAVLLKGESGVGKEKIAKFIHEQSERSRMPYIKINCAAIPSTLIESELFGYRKGSFTGAKAEGKPGYFELAHGGTLLMDEVGEIPLEVQPKVLRALQDGEIAPIGETTPQAVDVRIIATSNQNLYQKVNRGEFREDLFFRLNVVPIEVPPLRERKEEIAPLIHSFLRSLNHRYGGNKSIAPEVVSALRQYSWPGNVRELENMVEYLFVASNQDNITVEVLPDYLKRERRFIEGEKEEGSLNQVLERVERELLLAALQEYPSLRKAAASLQISPATMSRKLKKHRLDVT